LTTAAIALGHQVHAGAGRVGLAHRAVLVFVTKGVDTTLGAQVGIGARLKVIGLRTTFCLGMVGWLRMRGVTHHHGVTGWAVIAVSVATLALSTIGSRGFGAGGAHLAIGAGGGARALTGFVFAHALHHF
jgi:hypothetical protein